MTNSIRAFVIFEIHENGWDLSLMKISYNLTKKTTKTENFEKLLRVTSFIQSSITGLRDLSANYGYLKNKNSQKGKLKKKNLARKEPNT